MDIPKEWISDIVLGFTEILDGKHVITWKTVDCKALLSWIMLHFRTDSILCTIGLSCGQVPFIQFPPIGLCQLRKCLSQLDRCFYRLQQ